jgi:membrane protein required for colicin V production
VPYLQPYDALMLLVIVAATVFGAWKGMAWQVASLASLILSAGVAVHLSKPVAPIFGSSQPWNRVIAMLVLYLATSLVIWLAFRAVANLIDRVKLKEFDRQTGALFGMAKGILLCVVITFFAVTLSETSRQAVLRSRSGDHIARLTSRASVILPEEVRLVLGKYIDELDQKLQKDDEAGPDSPGVDQPQPEHVAREAGTASGTPQPAAAGQPPADPGPGAEGAALPETPQGRGGAAGERADADDDPLGERGRRLDEAVERLR